MKKLNDNIESNPSETNVTRIHPRLTLQRGKVLGYKPTTETPTDLMAFIINQLRRLR